MKVADILKWENTKIVCCENSLNNQITDGYVSDLLSDVMANANENMAWITIQTQKYRSYSFSKRISMYNYNK